MLDKHWYLFKENPPLKGQKIEIYFSNGYREENPYNSEVDYSGSKVYPIFWRPVNK